MSPITLLLIVFLVGGSVFIAVSIPLIQGRVAPNRGYGFRVRRTLEDPSLWHPVNAYSGWWGLGVGTAEIIVATAMYFVPGLDVAMYGSIVGGVTVAGLIIALIQCFRYLHQLTKEKHGTTR